MKKLLLFVTGLVLLASVVYAFQPVFYDGFSSGPLNLSKWEERTWQNRPFSDEHYVKFGKYHVAQYNPRDTETVLKILYPFSPNETLEYDLFYVSGDGNHLAQILVHGDYPRYSENPCDYNNAGCGTVGYWNGLPEVGNQTGLHRIKLIFYENKIGNEIIRPDGQKFVVNYTQLTSPYVIEFDTHTGHNGIMHFDYDNFWINGRPMVSARG